MGEAKRRKEQGLPPRAIKKEKKDENSNTFQKLRRNQILPVVLALGFVIFLIVDLVRYYNQQEINLNYLKDEAANLFLLKIE